MSVGVFTDKKHQPADVEIKQAIGSKLSMWQDLIAYIRANYAVAEDFTFLYGKKYGWACRFRVKRQLLTNLYPREEGFAVQINLSPAAVDKALDMQLENSARQAIEQAHPYPEGRWVWFIVEKEEEISDMHQLLALRAEDKRLL